MHRRRASRARPLPVFVAKAAARARATLVRIGRISLDGVEALKALCFRFADGVTAREFAGYLSCEAGVELDEELERAVEAFLSCLATGGLLEAEAEAEDEDEDEDGDEGAGDGVGGQGDGQRRYQGTPLAWRVLAR